MIIDVHPEFGYEIACAIPYAYWLHTQNKLEKVITCKGMKPFYYFAENVEERYTMRSVDNSTNGVQNLPNNWVHHNAKAVTGKDYSELTAEEKIQVNGVLDYSQWISPPYKERYSGLKNDKLKSPYIVVSNKFVMDHGKEALGYFDIQCLYDMFNYLTDKGYTVVYKRPKMTEFTIDQNEIATLQSGQTIQANVEGVGRIDDYQLTQYYDNVHLIDSIINEYPDSSYNEVQLQVFAGASGFISISGGNGIFCSAFGQPTVLYATTSGETREGYFGPNSYYRQLANADLHAAIDNERDIINRGYRDYTEFMNMIKTTFK
jgi:hypothetical protein